MKKQKLLSFHGIAALTLCALLTASLFSLQASSARAQEKPARKSPITFKAPKGYMPADFPEHKTGKLMLDAKRPAGMFIVYPNEGENSEALFNLLKSTIAGMFFHDTKSQVAWTTSPLPSHQGVTNESGILAVTSNEKMDVQLATYTRTFGETVIVYGYYAMRRKGKEGKDDGRLLDSSGGGVEDFDKFWQSIRASN